MLTDGALRIVAVSGPDDLRESLLGVEIPPGAVDTELALAEQWGRLRFVPDGIGSVDEDYVWIPDLPLPTEPDGWHPGDALLAPLHDVDGGLIGLLSVDLPVDGRRPGPVRRQLLELFAAQAETALRNGRRAVRLRASEESFRLAFESSPVGLCLVSLDPRAPLRILQANSALRRIAEAAGAEPVAVLSEALAPTDPDHDPAHWCRAVTSAPDGVYRAEKRLGWAGDHPWVEVVATVLPVHATEPGRAIVQVEDITERRRVQHRRATSDPLTGLANRTRLAEHVAAVAGAARRGGPSGVLLFCDLDDFKSINDVFGHLAGDAVLLTCAQRLAGQVREAEDEVFRLGGDEFVAVLSTMPGSGIDALVARVKEAVARPIEHAGRRLTVGVSVGAVVIDGSAASVEDLLDRADAGMYADKRRRTGLGRRRAARRSRADDLTPDPA